MNAWKFFRFGALLSSLLCAGCGILSKDRKEIYLESKQGQSLNVPADLDSPAQRNVMQIPDAPSITGSTDEKPVSEIEAGPADVTEKLFIDAEPDIAFQRVRDALEQAQIGTLGTVDVAARRIAIVVEVATTESRWLRKDKIKKQLFDRVAVIIADGAKSRIVVEDAAGNPADDEASKKILAAVRERVL